MDDPHDLDALRKNSGATVHGRTTLLQSLQSSQSAGSVLNASDDTSPVEGTISPTQDFGVLGREDLESTKSLSEGDCPDAKGRLILLVERSRSSFICNLKFISD